MDDTLRETLRVFILLFLTTFTGIAMAVLASTARALVVGYVSLMPGSIVFGAGAGWLATAIVVPLVWRRRLSRTALFVYVPPLLLASILGVFFPAIAAVVGGSLAIVTLSICVHLSQPVVFPEHPFGLCPRCGYDVRGLVGSCCPECGQKLPVRPVAW